VRVQVRATCSGVKQRQNGGVTAKPGTNPEERNSGLACIAQHLETDYIPVEFKHGVHVRTSNGNFTELVDLEWWAGQSGISADWLLEVQLIKIPQQGPVFTIDMTLARN